LKSKLNKGERTTLRILDVAEGLFAARGYAGTSLRQIAQGAGIMEPGLYNHFASKQALYEAVLLRVLNPMAEMLSDRLSAAEGLRDYTELPAVVTDMLLESPHLAALLQRALQENGSSTGAPLLDSWLDRVFERGVRDAQELGSLGDANRENLALNVIAILNLTTGYFLSQRTFGGLTGGDVRDPDNIEKQKRLLHKFVRAMLIS